MGAQVIQFPVQIVCSNCEHFMFGPRGMFCGMWREDVDDERVAAECDTFEHI